MGVIVRRSQNILPQTETGFAAAQIAAAQEKRRNDKHASKVRREIEGRTAKLSSLNCKTAITYGTASDNFIHSVNAVVEAGVTAPSNKAAYKKLLSSKETLLRSLPQPCLQPSTTLHGAADGNIAPGMHAQQQAESHSHAAHPLASADPMLVDASQSGQHTALLASAPALVASGSGQAANLNLACSSADQSCSEGTALPTITFSGITPPCRQRHPAAQANVANVAVHRPRPRKLEPAQVPSDSTVQMLIKTNRISCL